MIQIACSLLAAFLSPTPIWSATDQRQQQQYRNINIHHSHKFHVEEPRAIIKSVLSDVVRETTGTTTTTTSLLRNNLDIDVSSNRMNDDTALYLLEELTSLLKSKMDEIDKTRDDDDDDDDDDQDQKAPVVSIKLGLGMNKLTPSGVSKLFDSMMMKQRELEQKNNGKNASSENNEEESTIAPVNSETEETTIVENSESGCESDSILAEEDGASKSTSMEDVGLKSNETRNDDDDTNDIIPAVDVFQEDDDVVRDVPVPPPTPPAFLMEELDLSFNDIGGHGSIPPNVQLLDSIRRLFEGVEDGGHGDHGTTTTAFVPKILSLENCGIGPAICRQIGRGILNAYERNHNNIDGGVAVAVAVANTKSRRHNRPSILRMGGNDAIGDAGTVALAAALRLAIITDNRDDAIGNHDTVLDELDLSSCNMGDAGAEALALALSSNPGCLLRLNLANNKISDVASKSLARALVEARYGSGVVCEEIILDNNVGIGDEGAVALAEAMAVGAVKSISVRSCGVKAEGCAAFGKALMELANSNRKQSFDKDDDDDESSSSSTFRIDLSGNHFGTLKIKKKKGKASLIRDKASTNIKFIGKTLTSAAKRFGSETMGISADSDDDEEAIMGGLIEEDDEEGMDDAKLQSCGGLAFAGEILSSSDGSNSSSSRKKGSARPLKINIGMRQCRLDNGAIDALSACIVGAKKDDCDIAVDVSMNSAEDNVVDALMKRGSAAKKDSRLLGSMARRHMDFLDRIADARQRQSEAADAAMGGGFFDEEEDDDLYGVGFDYDPYDDFD